MCSNGVPIGRPLGQQPALSSAHTRLARGTTQNTALSSLRWGLPYLADRDEGEAPWLRVETVGPRGAPRVRLQLSGQNQTFARTSFPSMPGRSDLELLELTRAQTQRATASARRTAGTATTRPRSGLPPPDSEESRLYGREPSSDGPSRRQTELRTHGLLRVAALAWRRHGDPGRTVVVPRLEPGRVPNDLQLRRRG